jgi:ferrochelatase
MEPDVKDILRGLDRKKFRNVLLVPVGFLCDNVEVIYDLDVEAKACCESLGLGYFRASTVMDHPKFIEMMGRQILEKA